ncbi:MAG TPA: hypothetical protein VMB79_13110, partial [Jatrophihabitans sp.]|nr:hypothetical protein [Jatrophihabitans sp.]
MNAGGTAPERVLSVVRGGFAVGLLARPDELTRLLTREATLPPRWVIRLLGARMLAQSGLELASDRRPVVELGVTVDAVHAVSMLAFAARSATYRRATLTSA